MSAASSGIRRKVLLQMGGGVAVMSIPIGVWWKWAHDERARVAEEHRTRVRVPNLVTTDDLLIEKVRPGDVVLFDRRCDRCASGPWAALACLASKSFLCDDSKYSVRSVDTGRFDHIGIVVPGRVESRHDAFDTSNLLLMEATPSGIVARPLKARIEQTQSRSVVLLQLCSPGERRNASESDPYEPTPSVQRTREHIERELTTFRDRWIELGESKKYHRFHSTVALGGAVSYGLGLQNYASGPVSPSAFLVLLGLQQSAAAQNINERENLQVKPEDFLRDYRFEEKNAVRLRPGFRFLAPIPLRETSRS